MAGDQVDQQKSKQMVSELEKQKEEQGKNVDALIDQLKQERKKLKIKDGKLILLKQQLTESLVEIERYQRENNALIKNAVELKIQTQGMEETLSEKVLNRLNKIL
jgi:molybdopterin converting factor small subunit